MTETEVSVSEDTTETEVEVKPEVKISGKESVKSTRGTLDKR